MTDEATLTAVERVLAGASNAFETWREVDLDERDDGLQIEVNYRVGRLSETRVRELMDDFESTLANRPVPMSGDPEQAIGELHRLLDAGTMSK